ncbi:MAG: 2-oxo acid dehydrogenase subunit E2, partial [Flavobacteriales bacterium]|nr:2-oxo acid dehydrogenase subunit E2 [Flavobacteriales bacterium]
MSQIELLLPKMGESVAEATIIKWLKNEGDAVKADEPIIEIATDKVDSEVPAPEDGILVKQLVNANDVVQVGKPIALIATGAAPAVVPVASAPAPAVVPSAAPSAAVAQPVPFVPAATPAGPIAKTGASGRFYSPLVRTIAESEGV